MKLLNLASSSTTELELRHPVTSEPVGVIISGFTPDSKEWKNAEKEFIDPNRPQSLIIEKGKQRLELDASGLEKRHNLLLSVITGIVGIDDWSYTKDKAKILFENPNYAWMIEQWGEHLDERANFFAKSETKADSGSQSSGGSMDTNPE